MSGYIKIFRSMTDWEWYKNPNTKAVFLHLLLVANWKDSRFEGQIIPKGTAIISLGTLSKACGLSMQAVRTALSHLESTGEISKKSTNKLTLITVENYTLYQDSDDESNKRTTNEQQTNNKRTTNEQQHHKKNKNIRKKEVNKSSSVADELTDDDMSALMGIVQGEDFLQLIDKLAEIPSEKVSDYRAYAIACAKGVSE